MRTILSCGQSGKPVLALNAGGIWPGTGLTSSRPGCEVRLRYMSKDRPTPM